jgi:hypothetical protein
MTRRELIALLAGAAATRPLVAQVQQPDRRRGRPDLLRA